MANELREKLNNAEGNSENIIALILDIRGFTTFCKEQESVNVANFIKRVYIRTIDDYFPNASFYKPTGDGLLIVIPYIAKSLQDLLVKTVQKSLSLVEEFGQLCKGDEMVYFDTPDKVGIGISRGLACRITSNGTVIDYSGRVINLASRMNDLARPCGVVFDAGLGINLLPKEMKELFLCENVSVRGIAEDKLMPIYLTKKYTIIPSSRKELLREPEWSTGILIKSYQQVKNGFSNELNYYRITLEHKPLDEKQIHIEIFCEINKEVRNYFMVNVGEHGVRCLHTGTRYFIEIPYPLLVRELERIGAKDDMKITFEASYPIAKKNP